jgi:hypothetical protein
MTANDDYKREGSVQAAPFLCEPFRRMAGPPGRAGKIRSALVARRITNASDTRDRGPGCGLTLTHPGVRSRMPNLDGLEAARRASSLQQKATRA